MGPFTTPFGIIKAVSADYVKQIAVVKIEFNLRDLAATGPAWVKLATAEKRIDVTVEEWAYKNSLLDMAEPQPQEQTS
jgi:hypothetical protein